MTQALHPHLSIAIALSLLCCPSIQADRGAQANMLTAEEQTAGWRLLFDGKTTQGWRAAGKSAFPEQGWIVEDGWLKKVHKVRGGDIITQDQFDDFELSWEWTISPNGNNGVKYFIAPERSGSIGHEYQMLDDLKGPRDKHSTASFYDVLPPSAPPPLRPAGEINHSRVLVRGNHVEHWLNGAKVLEYTLSSPEVLAAVAQSKFKPVAGFGTKVRGHILLTDHSDGASFRNIKIRAIPAGQL